MASHSRKFSTTTALLRTDTADEPRPSANQADNPHEHTNDSNNQANPPNDDHDNSSGNVDEDLDTPNKTPWKVLFAFTTKKHAYTFLLPAVLFSLLAGIVLPIEALILGLLFSEFASYGGGSITSDEFLSNVGKYATYLIGLGIVGWVLHGGYFTFWMVFGEVQAKHVREKVVDEMIWKEMDFFDGGTGAGPKGKGDGDGDGSGVGALLTKTQAHIREFQLALSQPLGTTLELIATSLISLTVALIISCNLTLVIISTIPFVAFLMAQATSRMETLAGQQDTQSQQALKYCISTFRAIETVKVFNGQTFESWKFMTKVKAAGRLYMGQANWQAINMGVAQLASLAMFVQGFWYGSYLVRTGKKEPGQVLTTFWAALMATQAATNVIPQLIVLGRGRAAGGRLIRLLEKMDSFKKTERSRADTRWLDLYAEIEFRQVSFSYPTRPEPKALDDVTLFFAGGQTTYVVGQSGSGKSTIGLLLHQFYQPTGGGIYLDGRSLPSIGTEWLRQNITLVEQNGALFDDTIYQNIAFGREDYRTVTADDVDAVIKFAHLKDTVDKLPNGVDTVIGTNGNMLSGGQRQRLALARARIRDTPILVLDEATHALDYISRARVHKAICQWRDGLTTIVITHDVSQIGPDDYVFVMKDAKVVDEGPRKALEGRGVDPFFASASTAGSSYSIKEETPYGNPNQWGGSQEDMSGGYNAHQRRKMYPASRSATDLGGHSLRQFREPQAPLREKMSAERLPQANTAHFKASRPLSVSTPFSVAGLLSPGDRASQWRSVNRSYNDAIDIISARETRRFESEQKQWDEIELGVLPAATRTQSSIGLSAGTPSRRDDADNPGAIPLRPIQPTPGSNSPVVPPKKRRWMDWRHLISKRKQNGRDIYDLKAIYTTVWYHLNTIQRTLLVGAFLCAFSHAAATPVFAYIFAKLLVTFYSPEEQERRALRYSVGILVVAILDGLVSYFQCFLLEYCGQIWTDSVREEAMRRILCQPRDFFDKEENSVSRLAECLDSFGDEMRNLLGRFAGFLLVIVGMTLIAVVWSLIMSWRLTLVVLSTVPIVYAATYASHAISVKYEKISNNVGEDVSSAMMETFCSIRTLKAFTLERYFRRKIFDVTELALRIGLRRALFTGSVYGITKAIVLFITALVFWYGAYLAVNMGHTIESILETFTVLLMTLAYVNQVTGFIPQMGAAKDSAQRLLRLASLRQRSHESTGRVWIEGPGNIRFNDFSFSYPTRPDAQALKEVSFTVRKGQCTAIVGSSGSGKSTIASVILKLYPAKHSSSSSSSYVSISGVELAKLDTGHLRDMISLVPQTPSIFPGTIYENITYGMEPSHPDSSPRSVHLAASDAGLADFIDTLPHGYHTVIGDGGLGLSGGQIQRIAIARALVRKPKLVIFDEATSALDSESAQVVRDSIRRLTAREDDGQGRRNKPGRGTFAPWQRTGRGGGGDEDETTVLIITHSQDMMRLADHVIVMEQGRVVEEGPFEMLRMRGGPLGALLRARRAG